MSEQRLIDADLLALSFRSAAERIESDGKGLTIYSLILKNIGEMLASGELGITVDTVPRDEYEWLLKRFRHLLESDYIRGFDAVNRNTGEYKRDIREADRENRQAKWIPVTERLPANDDDVLVYVAESNAIDTGYYSKCGLWEVYATMSDRVTHWMPLPSAPEEVE